MWLWSNLPRNSLKENVCCVIATIKSCKKIPLFWSHLAVASKPYNCTSKTVYFDRSETEAKRNIVMLSKDTRSGSVSKVLVFSWKIVFLKWSERPLGFKSTSFHSFKNEKFDSQLRCLLISGLFESLKFDWCKINMSDEHYKKRMYIPKR